MERITLAIETVKEDEEGQVVLNVKLNEVGLVYGTLPEIGVMMSHDQTFKDVIACAKTVVDKFDGEVESLVTFGPRTTSVELIKQAFDFLANKEAIIKKLAEAGMTMALNLERQVEEEAPRQPPGPTGQMCEDELAEVLGDEYEKPPGSTGLIWRLPIGSNELVADCPLCAGHNAECEKCNGTGVLRSPVQNMPDPPENK